MAGEPVERNSCWVYMDPLVLRIGEQLKTKNHKDKMMSK